MAITQVQFVNTIINGFLETGMFLHLEDVPSGGVSNILGIAVYPQGNDQAIDLTRVLEQVETVRFNLPSPFPGGPEEIELVLSILNKAKYEDLSGRIFYYLQTPVTQVPLELEQVTVKGIVTFEPFIPDLLFANNEYNAIFNSVTEQRPSTYRQVADENRPYNNLIPLPANLDLLIQGTATEAQIPDSNYTKRGWTQARYKGSTTGGLDYGGIPGFFTGKSFMGSSHGVDLTTEVICNLDQENRIVQEFFHTGVKTLPDLTFGSDFRILIPSGITITSTDTVIDNIGIPEGAVIRNSLAKLTVGTGEEIIRFISYNNNTGRLVIERGVDGVVPLSGTITSIIPIIRTQVFRLNQNKVVPLSNVRIWIRDSLKVVRLDKYGMVYQEVIC